MKKASKKFRINIYDGLKALLVAMITGVVATCGQLLEAWIVSPEISFDKVSLILCIKAAIGAGVAYLFKNFFSGKKDETAS